MLMVCSCSAANTLEVGPNDKMIANKTAIAILNFSSFKCSFRFLIDFKCRAKVVESIMRF